MIKIITKTNVLFSISCFPISCDNKLYQLYNLIILTFLDRLKIPGLSLSQFFRYNFNLLFLTCKTEKGVFNKDYFV